MNEMGGHLQQEEEVKLKWLPRGAAHLAAVSYPLSRDALHPTLEVGRP